MHRLLVFTVAIAVFAADPKLTPEMQTVMNHITADSLRGHLSFIASDALEGRGTPSRGLDVAAEYIAAQFRRAGLEPAGDDQYFQTATLVTREQNPEGYEFTVTLNGKTLQVPASEVAIVPDQPIGLDNAPVVVKPNSITIGTIELMRGRAVRQTQVSDPEGPRRPSRNSFAAPELTEFLKDATNATATLHVRPPIEKSAKVRNVVGILRGSDPALKDTFVLLTAHYDHLGTRTTGDDKIYNGANDDGSGTVSVIEIASALASLPQHPKRSILFMTFFGEELGDVGSHYYGRHPLVPLVKTIADLNLEQIGRTDDTEGPQVEMATVTGFDFSTMSQTLVAGGKLAGIKIYKNEKNSDPYFNRSDNAAMAEAGVPAHTLSVAYDFPGYHQPDDEWQKVDYVNMAKVDRAVAVALMTLASDAPPPQWNASNPKVKRYVDAAEKLRGK